MIITAKLYNSSSADLRSILKQLAQIHKDEDITLGDIFAFFFYRYHPTSFSSYVVHISKLLTLFDIKASKIGLIAKNHLLPRNEMYNLIRRFASSPEIATVVAIGLYVPIEHVYNAIITNPSNNAADIFNITLPEHLIKQYALYRHRFVNNEKNNFDIYCEIYALSTSVKSVCGLSIPEYRNMYMKFYGVCGILFIGNYRTSGIYSKF